MLSRGARERAPASATGTSAEAFFTGAKSTEEVTASAGRRTDGRTSASPGVASESQSSCRRPLRIAAVFFFF